MPRYDSFKTFGFYDQVFEPLPSPVIFGKMGNGRIYALQEGRSLSWALKKLKNFQEDGL